MNVSFRCATLIALVESASGDEDVIVGELVQNGVEFFVPLLIVNIARVVLVQACGEVIFEDLVERVNACIAQHSCD